MSGNPMNKIIGGLQPQRSTLMVGIVMHVYKRTYRVDVQENNTHKFYRSVPIASLMAGDNNRGFICKPQVGDLVIIGLLNNSDYSPVVLGYVYSEKDGNPCLDKDEVIYKHKSGTTVMISDDGTVTINAKKIALHGDRTSGHSHSYDDTSDSGTISKTTGSSTDTIIGSGK